MGLPKKQKSKKKKKKKKKKNKKRPTLSTDRYSSRYNVIVDTAKKTKRLYSGVHPRVSIHKTTKFSKQNKTKQKKCVEFTREKSEVSTRHQFFNFSKKAKKKKKIDVYACEASPFSSNSTPASPTPSFFKKTDSFKKESLSLYKGAVIVCAKNTTIKTSLIKKWVWGVGGERKKSTISFPPSTLKSKYPFRPPDYPKESHGGVVVWAVKRHPPFFVSRSSFKFFVFGNFFLKPLNRSWKLQENGVGGAIEKVAFPKRKHTTGKKGERCCRVLISSVKIDHCLPMVHPNPVAL